MKKQVIVGTEKAAEPKMLNGEILISTKRRGNFYCVAAGRCPHCTAGLGDEVRTSGIGGVRTYVKCQHRWYLNTRIKTCKCLTCSADKRKVIRSGHFSRREKAVGHCGLEPQTSVLSGMAHQ